MATRPSVFPEWATTLSNDGPLGGPNRVEPSSGDKATGFTFPQKPPREWFNWLLYTNFKWLEYLDQEVKYGASSSFAIDGNTTTGLTLGYKQGVYWNINSKTLTTVAAGTIALTDNETNYIAYRIGSGIVKIVTTWSSSTAADIPLWEVVTLSGAISSVKDLRTEVLGNIPYSFIQNVSATDRLLGRSTAGAGVIEEITCTSFGRSLIDDADAATARSTLNAAQKGAITTSDLTIATARLAGRTTAATGALEEISVGAGLSLSGGTLSATGAAVAGQVVTSVKATSTTTVGLTNSSNATTSKPTISQGHEIVTVSITPSSASNLLFVEAYVPLYQNSFGGTGRIDVLHIHQDSTTDASLAQVFTMDSPGDATARTATAVLTGYITAGTTSATTIKLRAGTAGGGADGIVNPSGRTLGGLQQVLLRVTEIKV